MASATLRGPGEVMAMQEPRSDALIAGGGLAGAAVGILLARRGKSVEIIEKSTEMHDSVCGEFLSREAVLYLEELGINLEQLGAIPVHTVRLFARHLLAECALPFPALSLTRRVLDEALLTQAMQMKARVIRGRRVESLVRDEQGWSAKLSGGVLRFGKDAFLATGKHDVHGYARGSGVQSDLIALKMYFRLTPVQQKSLSDCVELILFPGGYAGLQAVEGGRANLCLLVRNVILRKCGGDWTRLLLKIQYSSEQLAQRLAGAQALLDKPLALSAIPYGMLREHASDGLWRVGDQAAVIPSFSGDGMSIALHSAHLAAKAYLSGRSAEYFQQQLHDELRPAIVRATVLSRLMIAFPALAHIVRLQPSWLGLVATHTRVPEPALLITRENA
jgi:flavin-dependent dehydrogenase